MGMGRVGKHGRGGDLSRVLFPFAKAFQASRVVIDKDLKSDCKF